MKRDIESERERGGAEFLIDDLLVRIHLIIEMTFVERHCAMGVGRTSSMSRSLERARMRGSDSMPSSGRSIEAIDESVAIDSSAVGGIPTVWRPAQCVWISLIHSS